MNRVGGGGHLGAHREGGTSPSVLLNASYHKKGEDLNLSELLSLL